jgi:hypothetical protein
MQGHTVRLAYRSRGARWTYSPTVVRTQRGSMEVSMLVPLRVGLPVEIERQPTSVRAKDSRRAASPGATRPAPAIRAQVTGCRCNADGLFRIRLSFQ